MNKPYRLKDKVTGLYYCPSRSVQVKDKKTGYSNYVKSNLSKKGKIYWSDPRKHIINVWDHTKVVIDSTLSYSERITGHQLRPFILNEWELEEVG
jgi:hypothetical protein